MSRLTLAQALPLLAQQVSSKGPSDPLVLQSLNFVIEKFLKSPNHYKGSQVIVPLHVAPDGTIALPMWLESIDALQVTSQDRGEFVTLQSELFQFAQDGPGYLPAQSPRNGPFPHTVVKLGLAPTPFVTPTPVPLTFSSLSPLVAPNTITIKALDANGQPIYTNGSEGFVITSTPFTTSQAISRIYQIPNASVIATVTIKDPSGNIVGWIFPNQPNPEYTIFKVLGNIPESRQFYAYCTRAFIPLANSNDPVIPGNLNALRYGMQAVNYENKNDLERAQLYWQQAFTCLNEELETWWSNSTVEQVQIQRTAFLGGLKNLI